MTYSDRAYIIKLIRELTGDSDGEYSKLTDNELKAIVIHYIQNL